jgi:hypothetical protein
VGRGGVLGHMTDPSLDIPSTATVAAGRLRAVNLRFTTPVTPDTPDQASTQSVSSGSRAKCSAGSAELKHFRLLPPGELRSFREGEGTAEGAGSRGSARQTGS